MQPPDNETKLANNVSYHFQQVLTKNVRNWPGLVINANPLCNKFCSLRQWAKASGLVRASKIVITMCKSYH